MPDGGEKLLGIAVKQVPGHSPLHQEAAEIPAAMLSTLACCVDQLISVASQQFTLCLLGGRSIDACGLLLCGMCVVNEAEHIHSIRSSRVGDCNA